MSIANSGELASLARRKRSGISVQRDPSTLCYLLDLSRIIAGKLSLDGRNGTRQW